MSLHTQKGVTYDLAHGILKWINMNLFWDDILEGEGLSLKWVVTHSIRL